MTEKEKQALLTYLDCQLENLCKSIEQHMDPDAVGILYDNAYNLREDLEDTLHTKILMDRAQVNSLSPPRKSK